MGQYRSRSEAGVRSFGVYRLRVDRERHLEKVKPSATTPDIRAIHDAEDLEQPTKALSAEAAGRYRSCLGKIGWLTQT